MVIALCKLAAKIKDKFEEHFVDTVTFRVSFQFIQYFLLNSTINNTELTQELVNLFHLDIVLKSQINSSKNRNQFCQCACNY